jgi:outer membrane protein, multidrug efflux system
MRLTAFSLILVSGLLAGLSACVTPVPLEAGRPDLVVPPAWQTPDGVGPAADEPVPPNASLARWWQRFNDPVLSALVDEALRANTRVQTAQASLRQARALRDVAGAALWPGISGSASAQRSARGSQDANNALAVGVDARWEIDVFGGRRQTLQAGDATLMASAASVGDLQVSIAAEVALAYLTLRSGQARLAIANANLESQLHTLQITEWRRQAGLVGGLDTEQARGAAEQTRALLPALQTAIAQGRHALAVLTGQPPAALQGLLTPVAPLPRAADGLGLGIPARTLRQRPDVQAAEWQLRAATARIGQAEAARLPSFSIGGSLDLGAATLGALGDGASLTRSLLASIAMPLFDAGAGRAQVRAQHAARDQAQEAWRATVLLALQEVEDGLAALRGDRERVSRLDLAAQAAARAAELASQSYGSGLVDYQRVLETQRNQLSTQDSLASAQASFSANQVRLYKALGGGWGDDALSDALAAAPYTARPVSKPTLP